MTSGGRKLAVGLVLTGALGCGGRLPGTGGDPAPTTLGGLDGEGLPVMATLPQASGSCTIGSPPYRVEVTASWDAPTRTFTMGGLYWVLDERGRPVEHGQTDKQWRHLMTRDDHGVLTAFDHELQGDSNRENSWAQSNTYDANGRLSSSALAYRSGIRHVTYAYEYDEGGRLIAVTSVSQDGDLSAKGWTLLYWSPWGSGSWRLITRERGSGSLVRSRDTRYYRDDGRLGTIDFVGGELAADVDGYIDVRATWAYDDAGHLVSHEEDGQEGTDPPHLDGVPDSAATFDAACAGIAVLPVELYGLESWTRLP